MNPARLVDEMLERLAEVELAQDWPDLRVVEIRLEVVELERVPVHEVVTLRLEGLGLRQVVVGHVPDRDLVARAGRAGAANA